MEGRQLGAEGLEMARVAEILVARGSGTDSASGRRGRRGSGYRVADRFVLTAAHVVTPPLTSVHVRFDADRPGEWTTEARVVVCSQAADLALLELVAPRGERYPTPLYTAVPDKDVLLPFTAVGFPRFKIRDDTDPARLRADGSPTQYRDTFHAHGKVAALSNRREGTLELTVPAPPGTAEPDRSPWQGMSGAVVWSGGAVIGMIAAHHPDDGLERLAATRVGRWYETLSEADLGTLRDRAGLPREEDLLPPVPSLVALPSSLTIRELNGLIGALAALPTLSRPGGLESVLEGVDPRVTGNRIRGATLRADLYGAVRACLRYPGTLDQFLKVLRVWEEGSAEMEQVDEEVVALATHQR